MRRSGVRAAAVMATLAVLSGCEWFSTMSDPPSIQSHEVAPLRPPEHAIPLNGLPEFDLTTADAVLSPPPPGENTLAVGEAYYTTFCTVCHGDQGLGNGPISDKFPAIPAIVTPRVAAFSEAYLFALVTDGRGLMPEYSRIPQAARWAVVRYVQSMAAPDSAAGGTP